MVGLRRSFFCNAMLTVFCYMLTVPAPLRADQQIGRNASIAAMIFGVAGSAGLGMYWRHLSRQLKSAPDLSSKSALMKEIVRTKLFMASTGLFAAAGVGGYVATRGGSDTAGLDVEPTPSTTPVPGAVLPRIADIVPPLGTVGTPPTPMVKPITPGQKLVVSTLSTAEPPSVAGHAKPSIPVTLPNQPNPLSGRSVVSPGDSRVEAEQGATRFVRDEKLSATEEDEVHLPREVELVGDVPVSVASYIDYVQEYAQNFVSGSIAIYAAYKINPDAEAHSRADKQYQDAYSVGVKDGVVRLAVADGTNFNDLGSQILSLGSYEYVESKYLNAGGYWAKLLVEAVQDESIPFSKDHFEAMNARLKSVYEVDNKKQRLGAFQAELQKCSREYIYRGCSIPSIEIKRLKSMVPERWMSDLSINGGAPLCAVAFDTRSQECSIVTVGDCGCIIILDDGSMMHGPSQHVNLQGTCRKDGQNAFGYDGDKPIAEEWKLSMPQDAKYLVVGCDGLWDVFRGPRRLVTVDTDPDDFARTIKQGIAPSIDLGTIFTSRGIEESIRLADEEKDKIVQKYPEKQHILHQEYAGRPSSDECILSLSGMVEVLDKAANQGDNLSLALVRKARQCAYDKGLKLDDITVVVIALNKGDV